ncbi:DinB family protein [Paenibacillus harenae]|uniref:Damage-inducible protein DinB n=1 Tax=Paenibacillus harenae TaxID=306543 RepID=A0ABT9U4B4_PAEHA|nr:DinB family protein [Paenibacillus harenae]MDQ0114484.1 putative damage-inducible protein DinB [Paenibacillus harenae]
MFTRIEDFIAEWEKEAELTDRVLSALTDMSLRQAVISGRRTLGDLAWHLVTSVHYMSTLGLEFEGAELGASTPESAEQIASEYRRINAELLRAMKAQWSDDRLGDTIAIMGEEYRNGDSLQYSVMHQAHHRGQMTVLMRQAGLLPPDIYGPTYEGWVEKGMTPLA